MRQFDIGDRVKRPKNVYKEGSPLMRGTVTFKVRENARYPRNPTENNSMLYDVLWDGNERVSRSYFWWGIDHE